MSITKYKSIHIVDYSAIKKTKDSDVKDIVAHTANTWQRGRSEQEKTADTQLGKLAEDVVVATLSAIGIKNYHSYDDFRSDNFKSHAPFDGIFCDNLSKEIVTLINNAVRNEGPHLSANTRNLLRGKGIRTVEIKSTRLTDKYKQRNNFKSYSDSIGLETLYDYLMTLDYITYPYFTRYGDMSYSEYCSYVEKRLKTGLTGSKLENHVRQIELDNATDVYIRVFMDEIEQKALVMGWIDRETFFNPPETQKLFKRFKSEVPLYFVKALKFGYPLECLSPISIKTPGTCSTKLSIKFNKGTKVENKPSTLVDFFKTRGCKVIDKRALGGALWVIGTKDELMNITAEAEKTFMVHGYFGSGRATSYKDAWWTKSNK